MANGVKKNITLSKIHVSRQKDGNRDMTYPATILPPWPHQVEGWRLAAFVPAFYAAWEMGTGKTKFTIDYITGIEGRRVLIVCPKKVISNWARQIELHSPLSLKAAYLPPDKKMTIKRQAQDLYRELELAGKLGRPVAAVLNYESFWRPPLGPAFDRKNRMIDPGLLMRFDWDAMILDESHRIKSPSGKASWGAATIGRKAERRLCLSGSPMPHSPLDAYAQYRFLDRHIFGPSFVNFRATYAVMGGYENRQVVRYINQEDFSRKLHRIMHRVRKRDVLPDLPPVTEEVIECRMDQSGWRLYQEMDREFIIQVESGEVRAGNALVKLLRLNQMAGGFVVSDAGRVEQVDSTKLDTLVDIVSDLPPTEPVVIFYRFTPECDAIRAAMEALGRPVGEISGRANDEQRWIDEAIDTVCVQIQAGGEGIDTLKRACYGFFFSKGMLSQGGLKQAIGRLDRPGQTRPVTIYHIVAAGTVDVKIEQAIQRGGDIVEGVFRLYAGEDREPFSEAA